MSMSSGSQISWYEIVHLFNGRFDEIFLKGNVTAHFDFAKETVDGAKDTWKNLLLLDAVLCYCTNRLPRQKRQFEHHEILRACVLAIRNMYRTSATELPVRPKLNAMGYYSVNGFLGVPFTDPLGLSTCDTDNDGNADYRTRFPIPISKLNSANNVIIAAVNAGYPRSVFNAGQVDNAKLILFTPSQGPLCEIHYPWANVAVFRSHAEEVKSVHNTEKRARIINILCEAPFLQAEEGLINLINDYVHKVLEDADEEAARVKATTATTSASNTKTRKSSNSGGKRAVIDLSSVDTSNDLVEDTAQSTVENPSVSAPPAHSSEVASESTRVGSTARQKANRFIQPDDDLPTMMATDGIESMLPNGAGPSVPKKGKGGRPPPPPPGYFPSVPPPPPGVAFVKLKGAPKVGTKASRRDLLRAMQVMNQQREGSGPGVADHNYYNHDSNSNSNSNNNYNAYEQEYHQHDYSPSYDDGLHIEVPNIGSALDSLSTLASQLTSADAIPSMPSGGATALPSLNKRYQNTAAVSSSFTNASSLRQYTERLKVLENLFKSISNKQEQSDTTAQSSAAVMNAVTSDQSGVATDTNTNISGLGSLAAAAATNSAVIHANANQTTSSSAIGLSKSLDVDSHSMRSIVSTSRIPPSTELRNYILQSGVEYGEWCYPGRVVGVYDNGIGPARNHAIMLAVVVYKEHHGIKANRQIYSNNSASSVSEIEVNTNRNNNSRRGNGATKSDQVRIGPTGEKSEEKSSEHPKKRVQSKSAEQKDHVSSDSEVSVQVVVVKKRGRKSNAERQLLREKEEMERRAQTTNQMENTDTVHNSNADGEHTHGDGESKGELPTVSSQCENKASEHVTIYMDIDPAEHTVISESMEKTADPTSSTIAQNPSASATSELSSEPIVAIAESHAQKAEENSLSFVEEVAGMESETAAAAAIDQSEGAAMEVEVVHSSAAVESVEVSASKQPADKASFVNSQAELVAETANASSSSSSSGSSSNDVAAALLASKYTAPEDLSFPDLNFIYSGVVPVFLTFPNEVEQFRMSDRNEFLCVDSAGNVCLWDRNDLDVSDKKVFGLAIRQNTEFRADGSIVPFHGVAGVRCLVLPQVEQESLRLQHRVLANKLVTTQEEVSELTSLVHAQQQTIDAHSAIIRDQSSKINLLLRNNNLDSKRNLLPEYEIAVSNSAAGRPLRESATVGTGSGNWKRKHNYTNNLAGYHASRQNNSNNSNGNNNNTINNNSGNDNAAQNAGEDRESDSDSLVSASDHEQTHNENVTSSSGRPRKPKYSIDANSKDTKATAASAPHRTSRKAAAGMAGEDPVKKSRRSSKHSSRDREARDSTFSSAKSSSDKRHKEGRGSLPVQHDLFNYKPPQLQKAEEPRQYRYGEQISKRHRTK